MPRRHRLHAIVSRFSIAIFLSALACLPAFAVTPGVDIAEPKVTVVTIQSALVFMPNLSVVEQGDYVFWKNLGLGSHTSTSGNPCVANGTWNFSLMAGVSAMRQFLESPANYPYFCTPHCGLGMTGNVTVTSPIVVQASDNLGTLTLTWTGGGGAYKVFRSSSPGFVGAPAVPPDGGDAGVSIGDASSVNVGQINYYLVMNK